MTDLTPTLRDLLQSKSNASRLSKGYLSTETADEFLKEAYRINNHINSLLTYLHRIRPSYLSINPTPQSQRNHHKEPPTSSPTTTTSNLQTGSLDPTKELTDTTRTEIDTETSTLLRQLSTSISTLSSAETLRQETKAQLLRKKYGGASGLLARWAAGGSAPADDKIAGKTAEQVVEEAQEEALKMVRGSVLWFLRRGLERAVEVQRGMVEKRVERVRERERSVLYLSVAQQGVMEKGMGVGLGQGPGQGAGVMTLPEEMVTQGRRLDEKELQAIEAQLTPEQLQLFAEENDHMVRYYEDTLSKVRNAEKSLLEISSLQQTLVAHLSTQEEYISQLVTDAGNTHSNIGEGNKELKRASERRSTAQAVFWGTVGLCTWLVVWDLVF
ncbi:putative SNARE protein (Ufe1) [Aspergillus homomorphus CBS 101889]|uniref:Snare protein n=1 Tax=Aspergillus homomorphus (strain CBS 101889) TaxID=1450537 RepID=A0A395HV81_ASPHC|nr:snare protein [Aspergillus homomorphus CBS 101889]RAL11710.1 snare protein [Aspergillus homomorphus CBS 101889]